MGKQVRWHEAIGMELVSIKDMPKGAKIAILKGLGYGSDGTFVLDAKGKRVTDKYMDIEVTLSNMLIFPGSSVVLDDNPASVAAYFEEYGDKF